jgi:hypothetical protein
MDEWNLFDKKKNPSFVLLGSSLFSGLQSRRCSWLRNDKPIGY